MLLEFLIVKAMVNTIFGRLFSKYKSIKPAK